jgi:hypothetical protein
VAAEELKFFHATRSAEHGANKEDNEEDHECRKGISDHLEATEDQTGRVSAP